MNTSTAVLIAAASVLALNSPRPAHAGTLTPKAQQDPIPPGIGPAVPYTAEGEYGDDLKWPSSIDRFVAFSFAYHANYEEPGGMRFRLYEQDGPKVDGKPSPGTVLLAQSLDVQKGGGEVTVFLGDDFWDQKPSQVVFTVSFGKLAEGQVAGLYAAGGPLGDSYRDSRYWQLECPKEGEWTLPKFEGLTTAAAEFVTTIHVTHVPEPSTWALATVGTAGILLAGWRGRPTRAGCRHEVDARSQVRGP
ncbi:MAG: PEP-CTERM sorting domain-containing protein [Verrucomicrobiota bacterium]